MSSKQDRRVVRTRQLLRASLLALIHEIGFDQVTVQDITGRAGTNRATFYLHYADKHDLLAQIIRETLDELTLLRPPLHASPDEEIGTERLHLFFVGLFSHVLTNIEFYRVMFGAGGSTGVVNEIFDSVFKVGLRWLSRSGVITWRIPPDVMISMLGGAYLGMVHWIVAQPAAPSAETLADHFMELVLPGVLATLYLPQ